MPIVIYWLKAVYTGSKAMTTSIILLNLSLFKDEILFGMNEWLTSGSQVGLRLDRTFCTLQAPKINYATKYFRIVQPKNLTWCYQIFVKYIWPGGTKIFVENIWRGGTKILDLVRPNGRKRNISVELAKHRQTNVLRVAPDICHCHQLHHQHHN